MFSRLLDRFWWLPPDHTRSPRSATALGDIVAPIVERRLGGEFHRVGNMLWVSDSTGNVRRLLHVQAMKGMQYSGRWGVSVDFVPKFRGGYFKPKRTAKSADFDLCIDPVDQAGRVPAWCSVGPYDDQHRVERVANLVAKEALSDFRAIGSLGEVAESFERRASMRFKRFHPENYVQTDLAWGLVLIAIGDADRGLRRLEAFSQAFGIAVENPAIVKARDAARAISARG